MSFINEFRDLLNDTITHYPLASRDAYGKPTYNSGTQYSVRLVKTNKLITNNEGKEVVSTSHIWILGTPNISPEDKIELSNGDIPVVAAVETFQDEIGTSHVKVYF